MMMPQGGFSQPRQWRRKTPVVLGILSIIFGSITAFFQLIGMVMSMVFGSLLSGFMGSQAMQNATAQDPQAAKFLELFPKMMAMMKPYVIAQGVVLTVLSIGLIFVGVGLHKRRHWARRATLIWVGLSVIGIVTRIVSQAMMNARVRELFGELINHPQFKAQAAMQSEMTIMSALIVVITWGAYPTILAVLVGRPSAVDDFEAAP
jgi:hypothetical protein